jgi:hypothetical protein
MIDESRRSSWQIGQNSASATFQHRLQNRTFAFASVMARTSRATSSFGNFKRWKAMRCADFGPTPGNRPSSSMSAWTGCVYTAATRSLLDHL